MAGLGNPGQRYANTPHNVGYEVLDEVAWRAGLSWRQLRKIDALYAEGMVAGEDCVLLKPTTFMNASGEALAPLVRGEQLPLDRLLIILDDVALPLCRLRLRAKGSSGGHNGLKSLIQSLGGSDFPRLRCGVAPPEDDSGETTRKGRDIFQHNLAAYVLARWPADWRPRVDEMVQAGADAVEAWLKEPPEKAMSRINGQVP